MKTFWRRRLSACVMAGLLAFSAVPAAFCEGTVTGESSQQTALSDDGWPMQSFTVTGATGEPFTLTLPAIDKRDVPELCDQYPSEIPDDIISLQDAVQAACYLLDDELGFTAEDWCVYRLLYGYQPWNMIDGSPVWELNIKLDGEGINSEEQYEIYVNAEDGSICYFGYPGDGSKG